MYRIRFYNKISENAYTLPKARKIWRELVRIWGKENVELIKDEI
jgi:hypothetical protein